MSDPKKTLFDTVPFRVVLTNDFIYIYGLGLTSWFYSFTLQIGCFKEKYGPDLHKLYENCDGD